MYSVRVSEIYAMSEIKTSKCVPDAKLKFVVLGDGGVGKTAYCERLVGTGNFIKIYSPTTSMTTYTDVHYYGSLTLCHKCPKTKDSSTGCVIEYTLRDTCGQEKFGLIHDTWYQDMDGAIIMFDVTSRVTYKNVSSWYEHLQKIRPNLPVVLVGNKSDQKDRKVKPKDIHFHRKKNLQYYDISVKTNYNIDKPTTYLVRKLLKDDSISIAKGPIPWCFFDDIKDVQEQKEFVDTTSSVTLLPDG